MSDVLPEQTIKETWTVRYEKRRFGGPVEAQLYLPHPTIVAASGSGSSVEQARIDVLLRIAAGYIDCEADSEEPPISDETLAVLARAARREQERRRRVEAAA